MVVYLDRPYLLLTLHRHVDHHLDVMVAGHFGAVKALVMVKYEAAEVAATEHQSRGTMIEVSLHLESWTTMLMND